MTELEFTRIKEIAEAANVPVLQRLAAGEQRFVAIEAKQDEHEHILKGNGKPGLATVVDRLHQSHLFWSKLSWLFIGSAVTVIVLGIAAAVVFLIKVMH